VGGRGCAVRYNKTPLYPATSLARSFQKHTSVRVFESAFFSARPAQTVLLRRGRSDFSFVFRLLQFTIRLFRFRRSTIIIYIAVYVIVVSEASVLCTWREDAIAFPFPNSFVRLKPGEYTYAVSWHFLCHHNVDAGDRRQAKLGRVSGLPRPTRVNPASPTIPIPITPLRRDKMRPMRRGTNRFVFRRICRIRVAHGGNGRGWLCFSRGLDSARGTMAALCRPIIFYWRRVASSCPKYAQD